MDGPSAEPPPWRPGRVLVLGDLMLDRRIAGAVPRMAPEAPAPVLVPSGVREDPGGAANLALNLRALGAEVAIAGAIGTDAAGRRLATRLEEAGIDIHPLARGGATTVKTRFLAGERLLLRVDEDRFALEDEVAAALARALREGAAFELVFVADHAKGAVGAATLAIARALQVPLLVDPAPRRLLETYAGAALLAPNRAEAAELVGRGLDDEPAVAAAAEEIAKRGPIPAVAITCGALGIRYAGRDGGGWARPPAVRLVDAAGAGDSAFAALGLALGQGHSLASAAGLGARAGALAAAAAGTVAIGQDALFAAVEDADRGGPLTPEGGHPALAGFHRPPGRIVFTNGCFDVLHDGHLALLEAARAAGDALVVGLNGDGSVRRLKGPGRPVVPAAERARLLAALRLVDHVLVFDEDTPEALVRALAPDVLVKGMDWVGRSIAGREAVEARGGRVVLVPLVRDHSTTALLERLRRAGAAGPEPESQDRG